MDIRSKNHDVASASPMKPLFSNLAKDEFSFLLDCGFSLSGENLREVRFQSAEVVVSIVWDDRSGELDVYLAPLRGAREGAPYSLRDLLAMEGKDSLEARKPFQVSEEGRLRPFLKQLADDVSKYASRALAGDRMYYRRLSEYRSRQAQSLMKDMKLRQAKAKADEAWKHRNYEQVVSQYESIRAELSASELKKLEIAKSRISKSR